MTRRHNSGRTPTSIIIARCDIPESGKHKQGCSRGFAGGDRQKVTTTPGDS